MPGALCDPSTLPVRLIDRLAGNLTRDFRVGRNEQFCVRRTFNYASIRGFLEDRVRVKIKAVACESLCRGRVPGQGEGSVHYMGWAEQQQIEFQAPDYLRNIIRIFTETGIRVYKELMPVKKDQVDLENALVWIPDSKTPNGVADVPLTDLAVEAFRANLVLAGTVPGCSPATRIRQDIRRR